MLMRGRGALAVWLAVWLCLPPASACVHRAWYRARLEAAMLMRGCGAWAVGMRASAEVRGVCVLGCGRCGDSAFCEVKLSPPSSAHFALCVGHFLRSVSAISARLVGTFCAPCRPFRSNFIQLSHRTYFSPPPAPVPSAARWTLLAARAPSSQPLSLSASPAIFTIAINALRASSLPLSASPSPPTLHSFPPDRHERPETEQPTTAPRDHLLLRRHRHRHHRLFRPRPVAARQLHQLFSSRPHRVSPSPS